MTTRSGKLPTHRAPWTCYLTRSGVHVSRKDAILASLPSHLITWHQDCPPVGEDLTLIVSAQPLEMYRSLGHLLRDESNPTCSGSVLVGSSPYRSTRQRYFFVGPDGAVGDTVPPGASVLVDQSVLIDVERITRGRNCNEDQRRDLLDHLAWLRPLDLIPGPGIAEASGPHREQRLRAANLQAAWEAQLESGPQHVETQEVSKSYEQRRSRYSDKAHLQDLARDPSGAGLAALNYLAILAALQPWAAVRNRRFVQAERVQAFRRWAETMNVLDCGIPGYAGISIRHLLLGKGRSAGDAARIMKISGDPPYSSAAIRGAAEDFFYFTLADFTSATPVDAGPNGPLFFMTADRLLAESHQGSKLSFTTNLGSRIDGFLEVDASYLENYSDKNRLQLTELEVSLGVRASLRSLHPERYSRDRILALLQATESALVHESILRSVASGGIAQEDFPFMPGYVAPASGEREAR